MYKIKSSKKNDVSPEHGNESAESQPVQKKVSKKSTFLKPNQLNIFHDFTDKKSSDIQFMKAKTKSDYNKCRRELSEQLNITDKTHKTHGNNYDPSQKSWTPERILKDLVAPIPNEEKQEELLEHGKHVIQAKRNDTGLPNKLKSGVENLSGISLDDVKVHYNSSRPAQLHALAYTQGTDIHVAPGQEKHLPHEAWHVVQQKQGRVKPTMQLKNVNINDDAALEHEADVMGEKAIQMKSVENNCTQLFNNGNSSFAVRFRSINDTIQLKIDHLFNDLPKVIKESGNGNMSILKEQVLKNIRDKDCNKLIDFHPDGEIDSNIKLYTKYLEIFRKKIEKYKFILNDADIEYMYANKPLIKQDIFKAGNAMWANSMDIDVLEQIKINNQEKPNGNLLNNNLKNDIINWKNECYSCINAVIIDIESKIAGSAAIE